MANSETEQETDDDGNHRLQNIQLRAAQLGTSFRSSSRLWLSRKSVLLALSGRSDDGILTTTGVYTDCLPLTSDGLKYTPVAVGKDHHWQKIVHYEPDERICLQYSHHTQSLISNDRRIDTAENFLWAKPVYLPHYRPVT